MSKNKYKFYAVCVGIKTGIFYTTWERCRKYTEGFPGGLAQVGSDEKDAISILTKYRFDHDIDAPIEETVYHTPPDGPPAIF